MKPGLTEIADRFGSDKGSRKHRYTELYHMLFSPLRERKLTFLEMGLLIGGPEHGNAATRETTDARIIGLDVSDFSWFEHERFDFLRCDMDERQKIADAAAGFDEFDIILDDASHASHHQQNAFLELFPKLAPEGLYIIEDLRWQPKAYEEPGITKTAALFQGYLNTGSFEHSDPKVADEFNALKNDISGVFVFQAKYQKRRRDQVAVVHKK